MSDWVGCPRGTSRQLEACKLARVLIDPGLRFEAARWASASVLNCACPAALTSAECGCFWSLGVDRTLKRPLLSRLCRCGLAAVAAASLLSCFGKSTAT